MVKSNFIYQSQTQTQRQEIKPKMLESLQLLALPQLQLETFLKREYEANPLIELDEEESEQNDNVVKEELKKLEEEAKDSEEAELPEHIKTISEAKELSEIMDHWNEYYSKEIGMNYFDNNNSDELDLSSKLAKSPDNPLKDFIEKLSNYLNNDDEIDYASEIIESVNEHGFLNDDFDFYELGNQYGFTPERCTKIHEIILNLEPKGIAARDIEECLMVQIDDDNLYAEIMKKIVADHFDDLLHRRYKLIANKIDTTVEIVNICNKEISKLDPNPGLRILPTDINFVVPDVKIQFIDNEYEVSVIDNYIPKIRLSRRYSKIIKEGRKDPESVKYVREKINSAKFLIKAIFDRSRTLRRVTESIINHQKSFFYDNSGILEPLTYSVLAEELQVSESTISRVVKTKYADTPFGIFCLKDFFSTSAGKDRNYEAISKQKVQKEIKKMIENEDRNKPLSDQDIKKILSAKGLNVSRRVIAKYRDILGILNSRLRRRA